VSSLPSGQPERAARWSITGREGLSRESVREDNVIGKSP
jgi:hypothetical protein